MAKADARLVAFAEKRSWVLGPDQRRARVVTIAKKRAGILGPAQNRARIVGAAEKRAGLRPLTGWRQIRAVVR
jgi:hypothetical protein